MSYFRRRTAAFRYALQGFVASVAREPHMRVHIAAAAAVIVAGAVLEITRWEWLAVSVSIALVIVCELVNTAIEKLCDLVTEQRNATVKYIKDISAAAVLVAVGLAVVTGVIVFGERLAVVAGLSR